MRQAALIRLALLLAVTAAATVAYQRATLEQSMTTAAQNLLDSLSAEQQAKTQFDFDSKYRTTWHFVPGNNYRDLNKFDRPGLTYNEFEKHQRHLADALLSSGLSQVGLIKAKTIMSLEDVLRIQENDSGARRDPAKYHFSIYGKPSNTGTWGWRVEGHHLSVSFTLRNGKLVSSTPAFFGSNPHEVLEGPRKGLRPLAAEEDIGFNLVNALNPEQKRTAIVDAKAYKDILTSFKTRAILEDQPLGLPVSKMNADQQKMVMDLLGVYASNAPDEVAAARMNTVRNSPKSKIYFAWAGSTDRDIGEYYRVHGPSFLVEYDNTQNDANHIHSAWRDFAGDFGFDVLGYHYQNHHNAD